MPAYIILDTQEPERLTDFWCELQGVEVLLSYDEGRYTALGPNREGLMVVFQRVPEPKTGKNRMHLDLNVGGGSAVPLDDRRERVATEVLRLEALGGSRVREFDRPPEHWMVMRDPEGNEFCLQ